VRDAGQHLHQIASHLKRDPELASIVHSISLHYWYAKPTQADLDAFRTIFDANRKFTQLDRLEIRGWVPVGAFPLDHLTCIGPAVGTSLRKLTIDACSGPENTTEVDPNAFFGALEMLEELHWTSTAIRFAPGEIAPEEGGLKRLAVLRLVECHESLLEVLASSRCVYRQRLRLLPAKHCD